jgi:hypothetical protein
MEELKHIGWRFLFVESLSLSILSNLDFINFYGGLYEGNILEYFSQSPFYDKSSLNEIIKIQGLDQSSMSIFKFILYHFNFSHRSYLWNLF